MSFSDKFPMMDPSVVAAAVQAGVDEESLQEMQKLLGAAAPAARRLNEPQSKPAASNLNRVWRLICRRPSPRRRC